LEEGEHDALCAHLLLLLLQKDIDGAAAQGALPKTYRAVTAARKAAAKQPASADA
jgi:hypothetical protein